MPSLTPTVAGFGQRLLRKPKALFQLKLPAIIGVGLPLTAGLTVACAELKLLEAACPSTIVAIKYQQSFRYPTYTNRNNTSALFLQSRQKGKHTHNNALSTVANPTCKAQQSRSC